MGLVSLEAFPGRSSPRLWLPTVCRRLPPAGLRSRLISPFASSSLRSSGHVLACWRRFSSFSPMPVLVGWPLTLAHFGADLTLFGADWRSLALDGRSLALGTRYQGAP